MFKHLLATAALCLPLAAQAAEDPGTFGPKYCVASGGTVQTRIPAYGTNDQNPLLLSGPRQWCQYRTRQGLHRPTQNRPQAGVCTWRSWAACRANSSRCTLPLAVTGRCRTGIRRVGTMYAGSRSLT